MEVPCFIWGSMPDSGGEEETAHADYMRFAVISALVISPTNRSAAKILKQESYDVTQRWCCNAPAGGIA
jgi:hypothetical protein